MSVNRGKQFENSLRAQFEKIYNVGVIRLYDTTNGYLGVNNPCDLIVYKSPIMYMFECKAISGNTLNFKSHIRENQWSKLYKYSNIDGVVAGIICWFKDYDKTVFINIVDLYCMRLEGKKSFKVDDEKEWRYKEIEGHKKRVMFEYDLSKFLREEEEEDECEIE